GVGDDERDVGALPRRDGLGRHAQRRVQHRAGGDTRENALLRDEFAGAPDRVVGAHREAGGQHVRVVELGDEALVDVAQRVNAFAVTGFGGDDLDVRVLLTQVPSGAHQRAGGAESGDEVRDLGQVSPDLRTGALVV